MTDSPPNFNGSLTALGMALISESSLECWVSYLISYLRICYGHGLVYFFFFFLLFCVELDVLYRNVYSYNISHLIVNIALLPMLLTSYKSYQTYISTCHFVVNFTQKETNVSLSLCYPFICLPVKAIYDLELKRYTQVYSPLKQWKSQTSKLT